MAASLWWLSNQVGSLADYFGIVAGIPKVNASNPYALEYASGPPYLLLLGFWIIAPVTSLLSLAGVVAIWRKRDELPSRALPLIWLAFFAATQVAIAMAIPHWLNLRYVGVAFGPFCLLAGLGYWYLISAGCERLGTEKRRRLAAMAVVIIIGCAVGDYLRFQRIFVVYEMGDLSIKDLMDSRD